MKKSTGTIDKEIGSRMRVRRMLIGFSQEKLSEMLGLTFQQVQKYEKGTNRISVSRMIDIANVLGVDIHFFFEGLTGGGKAAGSEPAQPAFVSTSWPPRKATSSCEPSPGSATNAPRRGPAGHEPRRERGRGQTVQVMRHVMRRRHDPAARAFGITDASPAPDPSRNLGSRPLLPGAGRWRPE